jgi:TetR/AcrR family transcriptional repressor of nem operon
VSFSTSRESLPSEVTTQIGRFRMMMIGWLEATFAVGRCDGTIAGVEDPAAEAAATLPLLEGAQLAARAAENPAIFECGLKLLRQRLT